MTALPASAPAAGIDTLDALLRAAAARWPDRSAVEAPSGRLTYAELDAAVSSAAVGLTTAGARPGDRVAFALSHDLALYAVPFVCSRAGVSGLLLSPSLPPSAWSRQLERAAPCLLVADDAHAGALRQAARGKRVVAGRTALPLGGTGVDGCPSVPPDPDRAVVLVTTSGTTGEPAVVRLTSRGLLHVGRAYLDLLDLDENERSLVVMPLQHIGALSTQTMTMPLVGGCNVLPADRRPGRGLRAVAEHRITLLDAVPAWLTVMAREPAQPAPTWRTLVYGGSPMPAGTALRLAKDHPQVALFDVWGLSEAHGPVTAQRYDRERPPDGGTVGTPLPGLRVRAFGDSGPLPPGAVGELFVSGPTVHGGTLDAPGAHLRDGWLPTGDLGAVSATGTVTLTDRKKELILRGGFTISAREVERVLCSTAGVAEAAVLSVADELGGEAVGAAVVVGSSSRVGDAALRRIVAERVGVHAVPRRIVRVPELPRNPTGKVDKPALRALMT